MPAYDRPALGKDGEKVQVSCRPNSAYVDLIATGLTETEALQAMRLAYPTKPENERYAFDRGIRDSQSHRWDSLDDAERAAAERGYSGARMEAWSDGWMLAGGSL